MRLYSPLRYPGGKGKMIRYFKEVFEKNSLKGGIYVEPYTGGGSVALYLLIEGYASKIIINDIDRSIFAFWFSVLNFTEDLCNLIRNTPLNIKVWREQKKIQRNKETADILSLGFSTLFLNRTNRSGILNAGVIGGLDQSGKWKMDARYKKDSLIKKIKMIASLKNKITLYNLDAVELVNKLKKELPKKTLFYLDPPYYEKGKELYLNYYTEEDHKKIASTISLVKKQKWLITYDDAELIRKLYHPFRTSDYMLTYTAGRTKKGKEIAILSDNMEAP